MNRMVTYMYVQPASPHPRHQQQHYQQLSSAGGSQRVGRAWWRRLVQFVYSRPATQQSLQSASPANPRNPYLLICRRRYHHHLISL